MEKEVVKIVPVEVPVATPAPAGQVAPEANNNPPTTNNNPSTTTNNNITVQPSEPNQNPVETNSQTPVVGANETEPKPDSMANNPVKAKNDGDLKNEILKKFQDSLGSNKLKVEVKSGDVVVSGSFATQEQMQQVEPLLKSIDGINNISINATVEPKVTN